MKHIFPALLFTALLLASPLPAAAQQPLTPDAKAMLRMPSDPEISPDGTRIAFTVRAADTAANAWNTQVFFTETADGTITQATHSDESCTDPQWSPDGAQLTFLSRRPFAGPDGGEGTVSLFALPMAGGEARMLAAPERDIEEYAWSPDGSLIAIRTAAPPSAEAQEEQARRDARGLNVTVSGDPDPAMELWILEVRRGVLRRAGVLDPGAQSFAWFPDSRRLVYQTNYTGAYNDEQKFDLWSVDVNGKREQLTDAAGPESAPRVSPDGRTVAFLSQTVPDIEFAKTEISLLDLETRGVRRLTAAFAYAVEDFRWAPDGRALLAVVNERVSAALYRADAQSGVMRRLSDPGLVVEDISVNANGDVGCTAEGVAMLREIHVLDGDVLRRLTPFSDQLKRVQLGEQRVIRVPSRDGKHEIEAVLVLPAKRRADQAVPLVLAYHGGPYSDFDNRFWQYYPAHILAAKGIATVMPNVRGSSGYDDAFGQANRYDLGGGDYRDAMDVVDHLVAAGIADSARMAVMGGSYGGYMTNWTITQTDRFKAAVSMYGIFSWLTDWSNSWQPAFEQMFFGYNYWEKPIDENSLWISRAPQTHVEKIHTPVLILQGDKDVYTNISNSREMYQALKELGREVRFVVYHGAGHGLRTFPNQWIDSMYRTVAWIEHYLLGTQRH